MAWRHKKESKWLVVGKRKVRCYLCGRKILRTDSRIYDPETGHYSHASCETERNTIDGNDRRKAVKRLAMGAGIAGLVAVGADKFPGFVSQSEKTDAQFQTAMETIITSQGIILPSLTSDPANPAPGQMWYRSDAGVIAHFDAIQNRVVYSSEINDGNVNVTSKGIVNGLSVLPNDGTGGFGPDTMLGATSPSQYGPPYTQTTGILEAVNYSYGSENSPQLPIKLTTGHFLISSDANLYQVNISAPSTGAPEYAIIPVPTQVVGTTNIQNIVLHGSGGLINSGGSGANLFNYDSMTVIDVSQITAPAGETVMTFAWDRSVNTSNGTNAIDIRDFVIYQAVPQSSGDNIVGGCDFGGSWNSIALNIGILSPNDYQITVFPSSNEIGFVIDGYWGDVCWVDGLSVYCNYYGAILGAHAHVGTYATNSNYIGLCVSSRHGVDITRYDAVANIYNIYESTVNAGGSIRIFLMDGEDYSNGNHSSTNSDNQTIADVYIENGSYAWYPMIEIENFHMEYAYGSPNPRLPVIQNNGTGYHVTVNHIESQPSSVAGATAGTVQPYVIEYGTNYKKMIFQFSGYENDSTTDQTIDYPANGAPHSNSLNFLTTAGISLNTTGLTISASTTGITITAPDSTTTYSGIVIVEGY